MDRVDPMPCYHWIWRAWHRLSTDRRESLLLFGTPFGGTISKHQPRGTPWSIVKMWSDHHHLTEAEMALLDRCIIAMDRVFAQFWADKNKA
ncbi:MAG: hypothetical protein ABF567_05305 [Acetobacter okinawensis]